MFDDETWDCIVDEAEKAGFNTIVLDAGDAVEYATHPEISIKGAWSKYRAKKEIAKCREKGQFKKSFDSIKEAREHFYK